jgi:bacterioferritin
MKGHPNIIEALNLRRIEELTAIDQYSVHLATARRWKYEKFSAYLEERIADETGHMHRLEERIRQLEGTITPGKINAVTVGETLDQMLATDRAAEAAAIRGYNDSINLCLELRDAKTRNLLESILADEDDHLVDIEAYLVQIGQMGLDNWLANQG